MADELQECLTELSQLQALYTAAREELGMIRDRVEVLAQIRTEQLTQQLAERDELLEDLRTDHERATALLRDTLAEQAREIAALQQRIRDLESVRGAMTSLRRRILR